MGESSDSKTLASGSQENLPKAQVVDRSCCAIELPESREKAAAPLVQKEYLSASALNNVNLEQNMDSNQLKSHFTSPSIAAAAIAIQQKVPTYGHPPSLTRTHHRPEVVDPSLSYGNSLDEGGHD